MKTIHSPFSVGHVCSAECGKLDKDRHRGSWTLRGRVPNHLAGASKGFPKEVPSGMSLSQRVGTRRVCIGVGEVTGPEYQHRAEGTVWYVSETQGGHRVEGNMRCKRVIKT